MPVLVLVAVAWGVGLALAHYWLAPSGVKPEPIAVLLLLPAGTMLLWPRDLTLRRSCTVSIALLLAILRYQMAMPHFDDPGFLAYYNGRGWTTVEGVVERYPDVRDTWTYLVVGSQWIESGAQRHAVRGAVLLRAPRFPEYRYGDRLKVSGFLETPPELESFSYRDYLARRGVFSLLDWPKIERVASGEGRALFRTLSVVRDRAALFIARSIPEPEASLLQGVLLGIRSGIPPGLYDDFNATGTSHIIVISGANVVIVSALFARTGGRLLGKRKAFWLTGAGIVAYVLLVGADAPVVRAGVMGLLYITARYLGRGSTASVSLCGAALFLTAVNPLSLWDASFQLSFLAAMSLILFAPGLEALFERCVLRRVTHRQTRALLTPVGDVLVTTVSAQILTIPAVMCIFGRISLVAPLANLLIAPVQPFVMSWGGAAAIVGLLAPLEPVGRVLAWVPWLCLAYTTKVVRSLADWPSSFIEVDRSIAAWLLLSFLAGLGIIWFVRKRPNGVRQVWNWARNRWQSKTVLGLLVVAAILLWTAVFQLPDGRLHIAFLDVGEGDAILITTPNGRQLLVDGGPSPVAITSALGQHMPFWDRSLDLVVATHADADHIAGLAEVLDRYRVTAWLDTVASSDDPDYLRCRVLLDKRDVVLHSAVAGEALDLGGGILIDVLYPPQDIASDAGTSANSTSLVLRLGYGSAVFLLTGDIEAEAEKLLLGSGQPLQASVLKVAHHGSSSSSSLAFLQAVAPSAAIISVGADNRHGHPAASTLERLAQLKGVSVLRTDQHGTIEVITDGRSLSIRTER